MSEGVTIALIGLVVPILGFLGLWLQLRQQNRVLIAQGEAQIAQGVVLAKVEKQSDGLVSRLMGEKNDAKAETVVAKAETVAATAAGDARVAEGNRTHEASSAAIERGAEKAVAPHAEAGVAKGTEEAITKAAGKKPD